MQCGKPFTVNLTTPPTTDVVLVDREQAAKVAESQLLLSDSSAVAAAEAIARAIRLLPSYGKE